MAFTYWLVAWHLFFSKQHLQNKNSVFLPFDKTLSPRSGGCVSRAEQAPGLLGVPDECPWVLAADSVIMPLGEGSAGFPVRSSPRTIKQKCLSSTKYSCKERVGVIIGWHPGKGKNMRRGPGGDCREDEGVRRPFVEGEPAAHGGPSPTRSPDRPGLRGGWHPPGNQLGQVPAASAARAAPSLASSPPRSLWQLQLAWGGPTFLFPSGPPCSRRPAAFNPARRPSDSGPLMPGPRAPATGSCQDCASSRKTGAQGWRWKKHHSRLIRFPPRPSCSQIPLHNTRTQEPVNKAALIRPHLGLRGVLFLNDGSRKIPKASKPCH